MPRILVVDNAMVIRNLIAGSLRQIGYLVDCAESGEEGLKAATANLPDLIITDIIMPGINGLEFLSGVRLMPGGMDLPAIVLSDASDRDLIMKAGRLHVQHYLLKSAFSFDELLLRVNTLLEQSGHTEERIPGEVNEATKKTAPALKASHSDQASASSPGQPDLLFDGGECAEFVDDYEGAIEALKNLKPIMTRSELLEYVDGCSELKALSPTVADVMRLTRSSAASIDDVSHAIRRDHAIAVKVLRVANSSAYSCGEQIESVHKAVVRIGMKGIGQAVMNIAVIDQLNEEADGSDIDLRLFWEHSIGCGVIAAEIARSLSNVDADMAFTMGLIHNVGKLVYATALGEIWTRVQDRARALQIPAERVESRMLLLNHADVMERLLHVWKFPRDLIEPIVNHHLSVGNIRKVSPRYLPNIATLALANRMSHALLLGSSMNNTIYPTEGFIQMLKIPTAEIQRIETESIQQTDDLKFAMLASLGSVSWPNYRQSLQERMGGAFRPLFVSMDSEIDAFRMFCDRIREESSEEPNIGVIHLMQARDRAPLTEMYRAAEKKAGVGPLPILVLSPNAKLQPEERLVEGRLFTVLPTPMPLTRFVTAVSRMLGDDSQQAAA